VEDRLPIFEKFLSELSVMNESADNQYVEIEGKQYDIAKTTVINLGYLGKGIPEQVFHW